MNCFLPLRSVQLAPHLVYLPPPLPPDPEPPGPMPLPEVPSELLLPEPDVAPGFMCPLDSISLSEWEPDSRPYPVPLLDSGGFASPNPDPLPPCWAFCPLPGTSWVPWDPVFPSVTLGDVPPLECWAPEGKPEKAIRPPVMQMIATTCEVFIGSSIRIMIAKCETEHGNTLSGSFPSRDGF